MLGRFLLGVLLLVGACRGTTEIGRERASSSLSGESGGAAGMGEIAAAGQEGFAGNSGGASTSSAGTGNVGGTVEVMDGGEELPEPPAMGCQGRPCGRLCPVPGDASGESLGFCDSDGHCQPHYPDCGPTETCDADFGCLYLHEIAERQGCPVCADGDVHCPAADCHRGACGLREVDCETGFAFCADASDCEVMPRQDGTDCAFGGTASPRVRCELGLCLVSFPTCDDLEPCFGLACGTACEICPPTDHDCGDPAAGTCGPTGECLDTPVVCR